MKTNIKLRVTPEQSEAIQKICFANGVLWSAGNAKKVKYTKAEYLFIDSDRVWFRSINDHNSGIETEGYTEVDADLFIRTNGTCVEPTESLTEECQFAKYGFEKPDFECEILKEYDDHLIGAVYQNEAYFGTSWTKEGTCLQTKGFGYINMNLTPIKKPWYETCKFPCLVWDIFADKLEIATEAVNGTVYLLSDIRDHSEVRLLTNDEIEGLKQ